MKLSPPIAVLAIAAAGIAVTVWLVPAQPEPLANTKASLPFKTQSKLPLWIWKEGNLSEDRQLVTTTQIIDELFGKAPNEGEVPENRLGPRAR